MSNKQIVPKKTEGRSEVLEKSKEKNEWKKKERIWNEIV